MSLSRKNPVKRCAGFALILFLCSLFLAASTSNAPAQRGDKKSSPAATTPTAAVVPALTRKTTRHEVRRFGYGGQITVLGAPEGSITIEAWPRAEVDITADIELRADTEEDLARLASVNSFLLDEDVNRISILSTGTHDKKYLRRVAKDFPKKLIGLPWKIDYLIRVPVNVDVEVNAGRGPFRLTGVEGAVAFKALESDATLDLTGGLVRAVIGRGAVNFNIGARSWRGPGADVQLAAGNLTVQLPAGFSADINADILRSGQIENAYEALSPRERTVATPRSIRARAGAGGATFSFTVGDGTLRIKQQKSESSKQQLGSSILDLF